MDYIEGLPASDPPSHYNSILVIVDRLTKFAVFIPTHNTDSPKELATILYAWVFSYFGLPDTIVSDRGCTFIAWLWTDTLHLSSTTPALSTIVPPSDRWPDRVYEPIP